MTMNSVQSTFPIALGLRITGVDDATFAQTGESYSTIALPNANSHTARTLQEDNTDLAYEARLFKPKPTSHTPDSPLPMFVCAVRAQVPRGECLCFLTH